MDAQKLLSVIKMKALLNLIGGALFLGATTSCSAQTAAPNLTAPTEEQIQAYWFDGAEISHFELQQERYGEAHPGYAVFVYVTEPFRTTTQVKADTPEPNATPVLKLNAMREFNTGIYEYNTMTSVFAPVDIETYPRALKLTTSVQDWCGQAFSQFNLREGHYAFELRSYFESEGDVNTTIEEKNIWLENDIWTRIRLDPTGLPIGEFAAVPDSLYQRFSHKSPAAERAMGSLKRTREGQEYVIEYPNIGRTLVVRFGAEFPYKIQGWTESNSGGAVVTTAKLKEQIERSYYWSQNKKRDALLREGLGLTREP